MLHAVIMAGGAGTRFWPESRTDRPKQLLAMLGGRTMIQATVDRLGDLAPSERVFVATTQRLVGPISEQLPELPPTAMIVEPCKRDTGPCIGLAAMRIVREDPDAVMVVMPSDHVIGPDEVFRDAIRFAARLVEDDSARMVTFGIHPTYPAESFGYIERGEPLQSSSVAQSPPAVQNRPGQPRPAVPQAPAAYRVKKFHEKPKAAVARGYLDAGGYYWNSGIFVWRARTVLDAIRRLQPEMMERLDRIADAADSPDYDAVLRCEFEAIRPISIDLGVMERVEGVVVIEAPFDWDDVGSWRALERLRHPDADGNVIDAARHVGLNTTNTIIRATDKDHVVVTMGVDGLIVIVTPDATLVANKNDEESIRQITRQLEDRGWREYL
jgi:mannose-1-phosphate guanylyltransferase